MNSMYMYIGHFLGRQDVETKVLKMNNAQRFCSEQEMHMYSTKKVKEIVFQGL